MERRGLIALTALVLACTNPEESDRRDLNAAFDVDAPLDHALAAAEAESKAGHDDVAADLLKRTAEAAANAAVDAANALAPRTPWGRDEKAKLVALESERRDEVARYESALRGDDLDKRLAALEKQLELEKRVVAFSGEIRRAR